MKNRNLEALSMRKFLKILKRIGIVLLGIIIILLIVRLIGKMYYNRTPDGGINESMYIDVNGQDQWINIYGEDRNSPVLLYVHGGPGNSISLYDWPALRRLAKNYTVVNWDQRNCGLTGIHDPQNTAITPELMQQDIDCVTDYILDYMNKDQLTIMGMSWGSKYGGDYAARHPEKVDCLILLSIALDEFSDAYINQAILDYAEGRIDFRAAVDTYGYELFFYFAPYDVTQDIALQKKYYEGCKLALTELTAHDEKNRALLNDYEPAAYVDWYHDQSNQALEKKAIEIEKYERKLLKQYGYDRIAGLPDILKDADYSLAAAVFFNPYYTFSDLVRYRLDDYNVETTDRLSADFPHLGKITDLEMPVYVLRGKQDCHCGAEQKYLEQLEAPDKEFRTIKGGHSSTMLHSEELAEFIHDIAEKQKHS